MSLRSILQAVFSIFYSEARKAYNKLPDQDKIRAQAITKFVQAVKLSIEQKVSVEVAISSAVSVTGVSRETLQAWAIEFWHTKGHDVGSLTEAVQLWYADAAMRTETGLKALWHDMQSTICSIATNIDWEQVVIGLGQFIFKEFVQGKVKI